MPHPPTHPDKPARQGPHRWLAVLLLGLFAVQALASLRLKNVTVDEIMYISAGWYHLETGDFGLNMTNPPLCKVISALPLLAVDPELPAVEGDPSGWNLTEQWHFARAFLYENTVDPDTILFLARLPVLAIALLLGGSVYLWASRLWGRPAGLFALFLFAFSPNILAHSRFATQDVGLAATMFIASWLFWRFLEDPRWRYLLGWGIVTGLALATKLTAVFLLPIHGVFALLCLARGNGAGILETFPGLRWIPQERGRLRQLASLTGAFLVAGLVSLLVLNACYGFQGSFPNASEVTVHHWFFRGLAKLPGDVPLPLPGPYVQLLRFQLGLTDRAGGVYFAGEIHEDGLWYVMPATFFLKTPIPTLFLVAGAIVSVLLAGRRAHSEWLLLAVCGGVMTVFTLVSNVVAGVRYVLPIYPFLFVLTGRLWAVPGLRRPTGALVLALLCVWYVVGTARIYPDYLAYFNESIGGPREGWQWLANSNLDWGQDLAALGRWMERHGVERIPLGYFGSGDPEHYGVRYEYLPSVGLPPQEPDQEWWYEMDPEGTRTLPPLKGLVAVSANILVGPQWMAPLFRDCYAPLRELEPVDHVGWSILIFDLGEGSSDDPTAEAPEDP